MTRQTNDWENPHVVGRNKEPGRASFIPYADAETALDGEREQSPAFKLLNGDWQFRMFSNPDAVQPEDVGPAAKKAVKKVAASRGIRIILSKRLRFR